MSLASNGDLHRSAISRIASQRKQKGKVLFHTDWSDGNFGGFRDHYQGDSAAGTPVLPIGLTRYPVLNGEYALKLSTPDRPQGQVPQSRRFCATYKNLSRYLIPASAELLSISGYFTPLNGRQTDAWQEWGLTYDTQAWDNSWRSFMQWTCRSQASGSLPKWRVRDNSHPDRALTDIVGSTGHVGGGNQNKFNWDYVEATVDLKANNGHGGYHSLQVNDTYFDLKSGPAAIDPTFRGDEYPQMQAGVEPPNSSDGRYLDFRGGMNFGLVLNMTDSNDNAYPAALYCGAFTITTFDKD